MTDGFERLRLVLARAHAVGVGCHHWSLPEYGVPIEHLDLLGLAKAVRQRIPACEEHGCHLIESCRHRSLFADQGPGRGGRKFRLTPLGVETIDSTVELAERVGELPLARRILDVLSVAGPQTPFALYWRLLEPELQELAETGQPPVPPLSRPAVRFYLDLLLAAGWLREDALDGTLRTA